MHDWLLAFASMTAWCYTSHFLHLTPHPLKENPACAGFPLSIPGGEISITPLRRPAVLLLQPLFQSLGAADVLAVDEHLGDSAGTGQRTQ